MIGTSIGRYKIEEQLGEGGMALVYKAVDAHLDNHVALKVIRSDWLLSEGKETLLARFEAEAKRVARLSHPNIIPIIDYGQHNGAPYLVMKYIPGGTLKGRLGQPIHWREAARLLIPIGRALSYAHRQGLIHRDVKPANILLNETGEPMLSDFGLVKILFSEESRTDLTGTSVILGTPEYMAPEQALGNPLDHRVDIYALGLVFYEMVTGRKPFAADTPMAVAMKHITEPLPDPKLFIPGLPKQVEQTLKKALAKNPADRYADASAFCAALENIVSADIGAATAAPLDSFSKSPNLTMQEPVAPSATRRPPTSQPGADQAPPSQSKPPFQSGYAVPQTQSQPLQARKKIPVLVWVGLAAVLVISCVLALSGAAIFTWLPSRSTPTNPIIRAGPTQVALIQESATPVPPTFTPPAEATRTLVAAAPDTEATERAANRAARTATAQARADSLNSGMAVEVEKLNQLGVIKTTNGVFHAVDDFSENWAQIGWYQYWYTDLAPDNFVIRAHTEWESASRTADWFASGCGFVFHETDVENHYLVYLALDGNVYLKGYIGGEFRELGKEYAQKVDNIQDQAEVMLAVENGRITYFVNGKQVFQRQNNELTDGNLGLTVVSGTNKDFGTRCKMTGVEVWVLDD